MQFLLIRKNSMGAGCQFCSIDRKQLQQQRKPCPYHFKEHENIRELRVTPSIYIPQSHKSQQQFSDRNPNPMIQTQRNIFSNAIFSQHSAFTLLSSSIQESAIEEEFSNELPQKQNFSNQSLKKFMDQSQNPPSLSGLSTKMSSQSQKNTIQNLNTQQSDIKSNSEKEVKEKSSSSAYSSTRLRVRKPFKYELQSQSEEVEKQTKPCQTKNIIKNFMRSVLSFLRKNQRYFLKLVSHLKIDQARFNQFLEKIPGKVNTIAELRELWTTSLYEEAFRLISEHFLRKYYMKHIFHSRIFNYGVHLKYRMKLLRSLEKPGEFTSLKEL